MIRRGISLGKAVATAQDNKKLKVKLESGKEFMLPQIAIHEDSEVWELGHSGELVVARWWAEDESYV